MATPQWISNFRGTFQTLFQLGKGGPQWKNNSGVLEARNATDAAYVVGRGATPVAANDWATKAYVDGGSVVNDGGLQSIKIPLLLISVNSTTQIPAGAIVKETTLEVTTAYTGGTSITVGNGGSPSLLQAAGDNDPSVTTGGAPALFTVDNEDQAWTGGPAVVAVTIAGAPVAGAGNVIVWYVQAPQS